VPLPGPSTTPFFLVFIGSARVLGLVNGGESILQPAVLGTPLVAPFIVAFGVVIFTGLLHSARGIGRVQVALARALLVKPWLLRAHVDCAA
jgi:hypothetical protein